MLPINLQGPTTSRSKFTAKSTTKSCFLPNARVATNRSWALSATLEEKKFHEQCYSQDASCGNCRQVIIGEAVEACNKHWHPKCFKCTLCYTPLGSSFIEKSNLPYCHKCASAPPASSGGRVINESSTVLDPAKKKEFETKNQTTKELSQNIREGKMFCAECGKMIGVGEAVSIQDSTFHLACFVCSKCKTPLANVGFKETNGEFFCGPCSGGGSAAAGGFCGGCGQKLSGQYLNAMGSKWHKQCFVCTSCKAPFSGGYAEKEGQPYCASCIQKNQKVTTTTQHYGERKPGFTVDPRSGTKKFGN
eukprot:TRINITY_DN1341_c0_g1_i1.p1 TRINITY_DN1341_c0_g1~~TRINITY_DN1341_c0_g1_i1.p1  ORF type:complete len:305 (+),score=48.43 TRINITY_DN1341_c0_g1_i1:222-1136(+)